MSAIRPVSLAVASPTEAAVILAAPSRAAEQRALLAERARVEAVMDGHRVADAARYHAEVVAPILAIPSAERADAVEAHVYRSAPSGWDCALEVAGAVASDIRGRLLTALREAGAPVTA